MKLLFLSMHYRPEPCDTRTSVLAREMAKRGHDCTVVTSFPNYPFGKVYDGYRQFLWKKETIDGVKVVRLPMVPDHSKSIVRRALSYLSFGLSVALLAPILTRRPDLIWIHHPPLTTGIAGWLLAKLKRTPYVFEVQDLWPESLMSTGMVHESAATRAIAKTSRFLERHAAAVVVTSPGMKDHLATQGTNPEKVHVVPQWVDEPALAPTSPRQAFAERHGLAEKFNVVFAGNIGTAQGLDTVLDAADLLQEDPRIQFVFIGDGVEKQRLQDRRQNNVLFIDQVPREQLPKFFAHAGALLMTLKKDWLFAITIPSKTQTYLHAGKPILCGVEGDAAEVVKRAQAGIVFPVGSAEALALAVINVFAMSEDERADLGANGRAAYDRDFSIARSIATYDALFHDLIGQPQTPASDHRLAA